MIKDIGFPQTKSKQRMWNLSEPGQNTEHERLQNFVGKNPANNHKQQQEPERGLASSHYVRKNKKEERKMDKHGVPPTKRLVFGNRVT